MRNLYTRTDVLTQRQMTYADVDLLLQQMSDPEMPDPLAKWLVRLGVLNGVPFNYLVPDEGMLPPESIRFFYLDPNWVAALQDGACSIGRNLTSESNSPNLMRDAAVRPGIQAKVRKATPDLRANIFGLKALADVEDVITGFVLRSQLVIDYPGMGINAYPKGETPDDKKARLLDILRYEQLGPTSDTLICLVSGDVYRVDIHEAPQALHYGMDCFHDGCHVESNSVDAVKNLYTFGNTTKTDPVTKTTTNAVTMSKTPTPTDISTCFRKNSRVVQMDTLAQLILQTNKNATPPPNTTAPTAIDSSEMGFEMTQGVGMVSFIKST